MGVYVITGASSGIGKKVKEIFEKKGHTTLNIDYNNGDLNYDLSKDEERLKACEEVKKLYPEGIDGLILNAGVGPAAPSHVIWAINFFAPVRLAKELLPLLEKKDGSIVVTCSNTITNDIVIRDDWVDILVNTLDEERVLEFAKTIDDRMRSLAYSSGKKALAKWIRRSAGSMAGGKVRINGVAPGNTNTPMTENMTEEQWDKALLIPIPTRYGRREFLDAEEIANVIAFLALPESSGVCGSIIFVDGGTDALLDSERM